MLPHVGITVRRYQGQAPLYIYIYIYVGLISCTYTKAEVAAGDQPGRQAQME